MTKFFSGMKGIEDDMDRFVRLAFRACYIFAAGLLAVSRIAWAAGR